MVESLKELNQKCQKPRYKEVGNWMVRHILRDAALPVTWLLLHTNITANQVTLISLGVALAGVVFLAFPSSGMFLASVVLLQMWYLLDHVDGQIARYRGTASLTGRFFDFITHHIIHGVMFFALGFYVFHRTGGLVFLVWGFAASIAMMLFNLIQDAKYKTFFEKVMSLKSLEVRPAQEKKGEAPVEDALPVLKRVFSPLHKAAEIHILMNLLTGCALIQILLRLPFDLRFPLFLFYGITAPMLAVVKIAYIIKNRKIDQEFEDTFTEIRF